MVVCVCVCVCVCVSCVCFLSSVTDSVSVILTSRSKMMGAQIFEVVKSTRHIHSGPWFEYQVEDLCCVSCPR